jgi:acyl phosphate:glycerol-3-phosphate acyltransferase
MAVLDFILKIVLAYLLGSLLGSLIVGKLKGGVDIRKLGSGNAGGTNALRTQGWQFALAVMAIDIGKGWLAVGWLPFVALPSVAITMQAIWLQVACAMMVVLGHVYPLWFGFRGGKGAATLVGVLAGFMPTALPWVLGIWLVVLMLSGFVGLSTMLASVAFNVWALITHAEPQDAVLLFGVSMLVLTVYTHRANIARMKAGTENRAKKLWLCKSLFQSRSEN